MSGAVCFDGDHYVPEGSDDDDIGQCARCGLTIRWNTEAEIWEPDDTITILPLEPAEVEALQTLLRFDMTVIDPEAVVSLSRKLNVVPSLG